MEHNEKEKTLQNILKIIQKFNKICKELEVLGDIIVAVTIIFSTIIIVLIFLFLLCVILPAGSLLIEYYNVWINSLRP